MESLRQTLPLLTWIAWVILVIVVIALDHRRRGAASAVGRERRVAPYLGLALVFGALSLPVYFGVTRRSARGVGIGIGYLLATLGAAVLLFVLLDGPTQRISDRAYLGTYIAACEDERATDGFPCMIAHHDYIIGRFVDRDIPKAVALLERGCKLGTIGACMQLIDLGPAISSPEKIAAMRAEATRICAVDPQDSVCVEFSARPVSP